MTIENRKFPIPVRQAIRVIEGVSTEVLVALFADYWLVLVSQIGNVGSLFLTSFENPLLASLNPETPPVSVRALLGGSQDEILLRLYASQILQRINAAMAGPSAGLSSDGAIAPAVATPPPVVVGLSLKKRANEESSLNDSERAAFKQVLDLVCECGGWSN
ncbi:hypothetical protein HDU93_007978 [Gonapodya sp. JEL0774]|nr:hypothetical protein HDU93_007978 [Gonapodya sp. JEL0774]